MDRQPTRTNCFMYALDRVHQDGGYLAIGMTARAGWTWQHLGHYDNLAHRFTSFVPPGDLPRHWYAFGSFTGAVVEGDPEHRKPMPVRLMYRGAVALLVALTVWHIKRTWDRLTHKKGTP